MLSKRGRKILRAIKKSSVSAKKARAGFYGPNANNLERLARVQRKKK